MKHPIILEMLEPMPESPSLNLQQKKSRPELTLIPTDLIFEKPSRAEQRKKPEVVLKYEADILREEMIGYVDAVI